MRPDVRGIVTAWLGLGHFVRSGGSANRPGRAAWARPAQPAARGSASCGQQHHHRNGISTSTFPSTKTNQRRVMSPNITRMLCAPRRWSVAGALDLHACILAAPIVYCSVSFMELFCLFAVVFTVELGLNVLFKKKKNTYRRKF